jgi:hypothetical protein
MKPRISYRSKIDEQNPAMWFCKDSFGVYGYGLTIEQACNEYSEALDEDYVNRYVKSFNIKKDK